MGAHTLLANGGIMAPVGTAVVAMAAKKHAVPFVVLVGLHKLSPLYPHDPDVSFNEFKSPATVVDYDVVAEPLDAAATSAQASPVGSDPPASCVASFTSCDHARHSWAMAPGKSCVRPSAACVKHCSLACQRLYP